MLKISQIMAVLDRIMFKWSSLHRILESIIGKSIFLISLALPISYAADLVPNISKYKISLMGALLVSLTYVAARAWCPSIISSFPTFIEYTNWTLQRNSRCALDSTSEFKVIDLYKKNGWPSHLSKEEDRINDLVSVQACIEQIGANAAIYELSYLKYQIYEKRFPVLRKALTVVLFFGLGLMFYSLGEAVVILLRQ